MSWAGSHSFKHSTQSSGARGNGTNGFQMVMTIENGGDLLPLCSAARQPRLRNKSGHDQFAAKENARRFFRRALNSLGNDQLLVRAELWSWW